MFINKVLVCVISLKSTGHGEGEFVRLQQGFKAEHVWRTKSLFSCVFYVLFRKRRKHFWHCYLQGTTVRLGVQMSTAWRGSPKWGLSGSPVTSSVYLCVSRLSHTMKPVTPGVTLLQHKGAAPSWTLEGTRTILSLCESICVGVACMAMSKHWRAQFCFVEGESQ